CSVRAGAKPSELAQPPRSNVQQQSRLSFPCGKLMRTSTNYPAAVRVETRSRRTVHGRREVLFRRPAKRVAGRTGKPPVGSVRGLRHAPNTSASAADGHAISAGPRGGANQTFVPFHVGAVRGRPSVIIQKPAVGSSGLTLMER